MLALAALALAGAAFVCGLRSAPPGDLPLQRASGGFGLGPAASADWSFHAFDPRIESGCEAELGPIPGGACPVPHHAGREP